MDRKRLSIIVNSELMSATVGLFLVLPLPSGKLPFSLWLHNRGTGSITPLSSRR
ncbi:hypothetical protein BDV36DRAFT_253750 [Aspergillus pseudocaelatus]|uniref:Uncharacterized protein n=1 Tax=Aspergillus pseudocaelatus TaxID=1825620 RepID=A0ABQ6WN92_9EURO|nr:hypothetical protein BDV36DRAFT_253750 [Aspergillus pseudocaelatus]